MANKKKPAAKKPAAKKPAAKKPAAKKPAASIKPNQDNYTGQAWERGQGIDCATN